MRSAVIGVAIALAVTGCGGTEQRPTETTLPIATGACVSLVLGATGRVVSCDSESATHRILNKVSISDYDISDLSASPCADDEVAIEETAIATEGPLTGGSATVATWCAEIIQR